MEKLYIKGSRKQLEISLNAEIGIMTITGVSTSENVEEYFAPVFEWLAKYENYDKKVPAEFIFELSYFNTPTALWFTKLYAILKNLQQKFSLKIVWYYDDDDMFNYMKEIEDLYALKVEFREKIDNN